MADVPMSLPHSGDHVLKYRLMFSVWIRDPEIHEATNLSLIGATSTFSKLQICMGCTPETPEPKAGVQASIHRHLTFLQS